MPSSIALRERLSREQLFFFEILGRSHEQPGYHLQTAAKEDDIEYQRIRLIYVLCKRLPRWLSLFPEIAKLLIERLNNKERLEHRLEENTEALLSRNHKEYKMLLFCLISFFRYNHKFHGMLFDTLTQYREQCPIDFSDLKVFISEEIPACYKPPELRDLIKAFTKKMDAHANSYERQYYYMELVMTPILHKLSVTERFREVFTDKENARLLGYFFHPNESWREKEKKIKLPIGSEFYMIELIKIASLVVKHSDNLHDLRDDLMKFYWKVLKHENLLVKQWGYFAISEFVMKTKVPKDKVVEIYEGLLS